MEHPAGESDNGSLPAYFDRRLQLEFHGSRITSDAGLLAYRELDDVLGLTDLAGGILSDVRRGKNTRHLLTGLFRQSVFGRLAGYEDVNDADRLAHDPAMRAIVSIQAPDRSVSAARFASLPLRDLPDGGGHGAARSVPENPGRHRGAPSVGAPARC